MTALIALGFLSRRFEDSPKINTERLGNAEENVERWFAQFAFDERYHTDVKTCLLGEHVHRKLLLEPLVAESLDDLGGNDLALGEL